MTRRTTMGCNVITRDGIRHKILCEVEICDFEKTSLKLAKKKISIRFKERILDRVRSLRKFWSVSIVKPPEDRILPDEKMMITREEMIAEIRWKIF
jgi:hypothetical protein